MSQIVLPTDLYVSGNLASKSFTPAAGCITDAAVQQNAGIQATKLQHQYEKGLAQASNVNAASQRQPIHVVYGANATIVEFEAGAIVPITGNDTVTVDLWKNGSSVLTAAITLNNTQSARQLVAASLASTTAVAGDVFEVNIVYTHNTGTAPQGVFCQMVIQESAQ